MTEHLPSQSSISAATMAVNPDCANNAQSNLQPSSQSPEALPDNTLLLNELIIDTTRHWQVHNCKLVDQVATQSAPLPFLYHYDTLSDELKALHPLTPALLARFDEPMSAQAAAQLLQLPSNSIPTPWQIKIIGTLVLFCESLQIALRLRFTNSAKALEPIYTSTKAQAINQAMQSWHFFGDVFVFNNSAAPIAVAIADLPADSTALSAATDTLTAPSAMTAAPVTLLPRDRNYQYLPPQFAVGILSELEAHKDTLPQLNQALQQRISE